MKLLGRSSSSEVVELNESFKNYDAIYVSSFKKDNANHTKISTSIFVFSEDINVGDKIVLLDEYTTEWVKVFLTISSETSFTITTIPAPGSTNRNKYYITVIGINL